MRHRKARRNVPVSTLPEDVQVELDALEERTPELARLIIEAVLATEDPTQRRSLDPSPYELVGGLTHIPRIIYKWYQKHPGDKRARVADVLLDVVKEHIIKLRTYKDGVKEVLVDAVMMNGFANDTLILDADQTYNFILGPYELENLPYIPLTYNEIQELVTMKGAIVTFANGSHVDTFDTQTELDRVWQELEAEIQEAARVRYGEDQEDE